MQALKNHEDKSTGQNPESGSAVTRDKKKFCADHRAQERSEGVSIGYLPNQNTLGGGL